VWFVLDAFFCDEGGGIDDGSISYLGVTIPNFDETEFGFWADSDTVDFNVITAQSFPHGHENNIHKEAIHLLGIHFYTPGTSITIIFRFPDRFNTLSHQEEHAIKNMFLLEETTQSSQFFHSMEGN